MKVIRILDKWKEIITYIQNNLDSIIIVRTDKGNYKLKSASNSWSNSIEIRKVDNYFILRASDGSNMFTHEELMTNELEELYSLIKCTLETKEKYTNREFSALVQDLIKPKRDN